MARSFLSVRSGIALKPGSAPADPANGDMYYDSGSNTIQVYLNGAWVALSSGTVPVVRAGQATITTGTNSQAITFTSAMASTNYAVTVTMKNTTDTNPQFQPLTITAKSTTGITVKWNANVDSANYSLEYTVIANT